MKISFTKMNGCGNDFVIIDNRQRYVNLTEEQIIELADRKNSITKGCDQVIVLEPSGNADVFMRIYNPDGSEAQACGNATRCVADLLIGGARTTKMQEIHIETIERVLPCWTPDEGGLFDQKGIISVNMGKALSYAEVDLGSEYAELGQAISVNVGNPHCVFFVDDADKINLEYWGPKVETHPLFPERTNVEFVSRMESTNEAITCRVRVWERGAGITKACGSGATAITWIFKEKQLFKNNNVLSLKMDGGALILLINTDGDVLMFGQTELEFSKTVKL